MKQVVLSMLGLALIAGCSGYDYYKTDVRYRQKGNDCVYYYSEDGENFNGEIRNLEDAKKIVYRKKRERKELVFFGKAIQAFAEGIIEITKFF